MSEAVNGAAGVGPIPGVRLIRYHSWRDRPPHRVTLRLIGESEQIAGRYADSTWVFDIEPTARPFELILDGQVVSERQTPDARKAAFDIDEDQVAFGSAPIPIDDGRLQQLWFKQGVVDQDRWDVIVVGTGIGGGSVIAELARQQYRDKNWPKFTVLGLEAGSLLFTGHVANQPRVLFGRSGNGATALWNSLDVLGSRPYERAEHLKVDGAWGGYQVFALGGRSLFWGGLCPQMDRADLTTWPKKVVAELRRPNSFGPSYYDRAEETLGVNKSRRTGLERDCLRLLDRLYPGRVNAPAPVAIPRPKRSDWTIPDGMFSTAELLLAQRLGRADGEDSYGPPYIDLAQLVVAVEPDAEGWVVHCVDLRDGSPTFRRARKVVLGAGTIETPRIMKTSALRRAPESIGHFLTEHMMAHMWFEIPRSSPYYRSARAAHLLSRPGRRLDEPFDLGRCNVQLQVNSDLIFDQPRMPGVPPNQTETKDGAVAAQLVFMAGRDLDPGGQVTFDNSTPWLPGLGGVRRPPAALLNLSRSDRVPQGWDDIGRTVIDELGGECLPNLADTVTLSASGAVSHEVGTMRMGASRDGAVVDENLQVFGQRGLYVCDNSVFASSPAANPSLTLAALGIRLADHLWSAK